MEKRVKEVSDREIDRRSKDLIRTDKLSIDIDVNKETKLGVKRTQMNVMLLNADKNE